VVVAGIALLLWVFTRPADPTMQLEGTRHIRYVACIGERTRPVAWS
jgi:hypothetical protein